MATEKGKGYMIVNTSNSPENVKEFASFIGNIEIYLTLEKVLKAFATLYTLFKETAIHTQPETLTKIVDGTKFNYNGEVFEIITVRVVK